MLQEHISSKRHEFQSLVLAVVSKEVVPEFKMLQGDESLLDTTMNELLTISVTELCTNINWFTSLTPKQGFCWGIVATCSAKIPVKVDSLLWLQNYHYLINQLCHIFEAYCSDQGLREDERLLKDDLPANVRCYDDIKT